MADLFDPNYEYDAPMFVDFSAKVDEEGPVDAWFDCRSGDDGGIEKDSLMFEPSEAQTLESEVPSTTCNKTGIEADSLEENTIEGEESNIKNMETAKEPKVCSISPDTGIDTDSLEEDSAKENEAPNIPTIEAVKPVEPEITSKPPEKTPSVAIDMPQRLENTAPSETNDSDVVNPDNKPVKRNNIVLSTASWSRKTSAPPSEKNAFQPPMKKTKPSSPLLTRARANAAKAPRKSHRQSRPRTASTCSNASSKSEGDNCVFQPSARSGAPKAKKPLLTLPSTPNVLKRPKMKPKTHVEKTHEEQELEEINKMREMFRAKMKQHDDYRKKAQKQAAYKPVRSVDQLTRPQEFHFQTDSRVKPSANQNCPEKKEKDFVETLRQHPPSPSFKNKGVTKPEPFSFDNGSRKRKHEDSGDNGYEGFVSMAERCYTFQTKTPPRFRSRRSQEQSEDDVPSQHGKQKKGLTCPKTPNLTTSDRHRPRAADCLSREEEEERIVEEMRSYKFKAREFDPKIVEKSGTYGVKSSTAKPVTEPEPFNLTTDNRGEIYKQKLEETLQEDKPAPFKAQPVPEYKKMEFKPELPHQATAPAPFSFEQRNKEALAKKEKKIQEMLEEEKKAREFKAQPLRSFSPQPLLPSTSRLQATKFEPFNLETENRGSVKAEKWLNSVQQELEEEKKKVVFKSHSANVLYKPAFVPKKSLKPATVCDNVVLNSDKRAQERAIYEMQKHEKEMEEEAILRQREEEREEEERRNIAMLRQQMVHKANPIARFKGVQILPSEKPLTEAHSPAWHTRSRSNIRI